MCGITGLIDFGAGSEPYRATIESMTALLAARGPDASGVWLDGPVALGHRRLSVLDREGGAQPMLATGRDGHVLALTFSGEIYNHAAIRRDLAGRGHTFATRSDTEVLLRAFAEWDLDCVGRFDGMFAFAIWDSGRQRLVLGRDRLGIKPLYYAGSAARFAFGSEPKCILASGLLRSRVDADGLREILDMVKTPGAAVFTGMRELLPGHLMTVTPGGTELHRYWSLTAREHTDSADDTVVHTRALLDRVVRDQLVSDVPVCTLLSGGLDSSAITALAAARLGPGATRSFAVDFRSDVDRFERDAVRSSSDSPYAREVGDHLGIDHREILLDSADLLDPEVRARVLAATDLPPAYWGDMWPSLLLLFDRIKQDSTVALSGEGADELFGGYQWFFNAKAVAADTFPWLTAGSARYFGGTKLFDRGFLQQLDLEAARADAYATESARAPRLDGESDHEARLRKIGYLNLTRFMQTLLDRKDRMSMATGLEVRVPFCDHQLVEYVFNVPWAMKTSDGREKSLLRDAVRPDLPGSVLTRRKNPYPAVQDAAYETGLRAMLAEIVADPNAPVTPLLDEVRVKAELDRSATGVSQPYTRGSMEMCIWLNSWLTRYSVGIDL